MCSPDFGVLHRDLEYSASSELLVSGTFRKIPPFRGSRYSQSCAQGIQRPFTRFWHVKGLALESVSGDSVAQDRFVDISMNGRGQELAALYEKEGNSVVRDNLQGDQVGRLVLEARALPQERVQNNRNFKMNLAALLNCRDKTRACKRALKVLPGKLIERENTKKLNEWALTGESLLPGVLMKHQKNAKKHKNSQDNENLLGRAGTRGHRSPLYCRKIDQLRQDLLDFKGQILVEQAKCLPAVINATEVQLTRKAKNSETEEKPLYAVSKWVQIGQTDKETAKTALSPVRDIFRPPKPHSSNARYRMRKCRQFGNGTKRNLSFRDLAVKNLPESERFRSAARAGRGNEITTDFDGTFGRPVTQQ